MSKVSKRSKNGGNTRFLADLPQIQNLSILEDPLTITNIRIQIERQMPRKERENSFLSRFDSNSKLKQSEWPYNVN